MFRAALCPSSGARDYYTVGCRLWCLMLGFHVVGMVWSWGLYQAPKTTGGNQLYNTLNLLMMGIMVPETCWASNKTCNKKHLLHLVRILFPHSSTDIAKTNASSALYNWLHWISARNLRKLTRPGLRGSFVSLKAAKRKLMSFVQGLITTNRQRGFVLWWRGLYQRVISINPALNSYNDDYIITRNTLETIRSPDPSSSRNQAPIVCNYELNFPVTLQAFPHPSSAAPMPTQLLIKWAPVLFPGAKRLGRGFDNPPSSSAEVKERVEFYLYSPSGPSWTVLGEVLHLQHCMHGIGTATPLGLRVFICLNVLFCDASSF
jgi:hypothetical protein